MKRLLLLLPLLLSGVPLSAHAQPEAGQQLVVPAKTASAWLVLIIGNGDQDGAIEAIQMQDLNQCEEQGAVWASSERIMFKRGDRTSFGFECLEGK